MVNEKFKVTKVVDLVIRNSGKLSLLFSDLSMIFNRFYKFTVLEKQKEKKSPR